MVDPKNAGETLEESEVDADVPTSFASDSAEVEFWRRRTKTFERKWRETQDELEEYQTSSRELEAELEMQLDQTEAKAHELKSQNQKLAIDNESLRHNYECLQSETNKQISALADDLSSVSKTREDLTAYVRDIEQKNDDLERSKRHMISSLEDFEQRLNAALERNAFLESELEEKDQLQATIQRLKDESKDMRLEISLKSGRVAAASDAEKNDQRQHPQRQRTHGGSPLTTSSPNISGNQLTTDASSTEADPKLQSLASSDHLDHQQQQLDQRHLHQQRLQSQHYPHQRPAAGVAAGAAAAGGSTRPSNLGLTPNSRMIAMTLVGDLLQKVNALESRLATYRNHVRDKETPAGVLGEGGGGGEGVLVGDKAMSTGGVVVVGSGGDGEIDGGDVSKEVVAKARVIEAGRDTPLLSPGNVTSTSLNVIQPARGDDLVL